MQANSEILQICSGFHTSNEIGFPAISGDFCHRFRFVRTRTRQAGRSLNRSDCLLKSRYSVFVFVLVEGNSLIYENFRFVGGDRKRRLLASSQIKITPFINYCQQLFILFNAI
jgi:hypothetical protein